MALEKVITYDYEIRKKYKFIQERERTAIVKMEKKYLIRIKEEY